MVDDTDEGILQLGAAGGQTGWMCQRKAECNEADVEGPAWRSACWTVLRS